MKFIVRRTSEWSDEVSPCKGAKRELVKCADVRSARDPKNIPMYAKNPQKWYEDGYGHTVIRNQIVRYFDRAMWVMEIDSLETLMKFIRKQGTVVVSDAGVFGNSLPEIEIYDDYRE